MSDENGTYEPESEASTTVADKPKRTKKPKAPIEPDAKPVKARKVKAAAPPVRDLRAVSNAALALKQASDATRLQVLLLLREKDLNVTELCAELGNMTQPAVSHHLALLRHGRLITPQRSGKNIYYGLTSEGRTLADVVAGMIQ